MAETADIDVGDFRHTVSAAGDTDLLRLVSEVKKLDEIQRQRWTAASATSSTSVERNGVGAALPDLSGECLPRVSSAVSGPPESVATFHPLGSGSESVATFNLHNGNVSSRGHTPTVTFASPGYSPHRLVPGTISVPAPKGPALRRAASSQEGPRHGGPRPAAPPQLSYRPPKLDAPAQRLSGSLFSLADPQMIKKVSRHAPRFSVSPKQGAAALSAACKKSPRFSTSVGVRNFRLEAAPDDFSRENDSRDDVGRGRAGRGGPQSQSTYQEQSARRPRERSSTSSAGGFLSGLKRLLGMGEAPDDDDPAAVAREQLKIQKQLQHLPLLKMDFVDLARSIRTPRGEFSSRSPSPAKSGVLPSPTGVLDQVRSWDSLSKPKLRNASLKSSSTTQKLPVPRVRDDSPVVLLSAGGEGQTTRARFAGPSSPMDLSLGFHPTVFSRNLGATSGSAVGDHSGGRFSTGPYRSYVPLPTRKINLDGLVSSSQQNDVAGGGPQQQSSLIVSRSEEGGPPNVIGSADEADHYTADRASVNHKPVQLFYPSKHSSSDENTQNAPSFIQSVVPRTRTSFPQEGVRFAETVTTGGAVTSPKSGRGRGRGGPFVRITVPDSPPCGGRSGGCGVDDVVVWPPTPPVNVVVAGGGDSRTEGAHRSRPPPSSLRDGSLVAASREAMRINSLLVSKEVGEATPF